MNDADDTQRLRLLRDSIRQPRARQQFSRRVAQGSLPRSTPWLLLLRTSSRLAKRIPQGSSMLSDVMPGGPKYNSEEESPSCQPGLRRNAFLDSPLSLGTPRHPNDGCGCRVLPRSVARWRRRLGHLCPLCYHLSHFTEAREGTELHSLDGDTADGAHGHPIPVGNKLDECGAAHTDARACHVQVVREGRFVTGRAVPRASQNV